MPRPTGFVKSLLSVVFGSSDIGLSPRSGKLHWLAEQLLTVGRSAALPTYVGRIIDQRKEPPEVVFERLF